LICGSVQCVNSENPLCIMDSNPIVLIPKAVLWGRQTHGDCIMLGQNYCLLIKQHVLEVTIIYGSFMFMFNLMTNEC